MLADYLTVDEQRVLHRRRHTALNHTVLALLRSPLHHVLDTELCELSYRAPRSGRAVTLPVMYAVDGADLVVLVGDAPEKIWWRAFRGSRPVSIRRGDTTRHGVARLLPPDDPRYAAATDAYDRRHGIRPVDTDRVVLIEGLTPLDGAAQAGPTPAP
jgi:hypothetical protein